MTKQELIGRELRQKFINFFKNHPDLPHQEILSASLVPSEEEQLKGKEKVLFTSAGMQPLIPYLTGEKGPPSKRLVDVQKCLRTDDIEEVGDEVHHTFFEMLGNWSIGDYWKEDAIKLSFEFLTKELEIPIEKLAVTVFAGDEDASKDEESAGIWKSLGIPEDRIFYFGKSQNWWPTAGKEQDSGEYKNPFGPCGPDTEMFYWTGEGQPEGKPNEDPRWVEIWNDVFMQFSRREDGILEDLPQKNVDTGMGLERTLAVLTGKKSDYETDLYLPIIKIIEQETDKEYHGNEVVMRIIADHVKAAVFLILEGVTPSNKLQGYVLRRLLRRAAVKVHQLNKDAILGQALEIISRPIFQMYDEHYKISAMQNQQLVRRIILDEMIKFSVTLYQGLKEVEKITAIDGKKAFDLYQTFGFPYEVTEELFRQKGQQIDREQFKKEFEKHRELSRVASAGMFRGGLADQSEIVTKYHTATHLLHQALRDVLGPEVFQRGSNITSERLRFDFSFERKLTDEEIRQVEDIVNKRIKENLKVDRKIVSLDEAKKLNAVGLFNEKYGIEVSIYGVGPGFILDPKAKDQRVRGDYYSLEFCGGPHVEHTGVIGKIKITKEEAISSGVRRIRAQLVA